ncbi:MAG: phosphonoacetaldehyde dehydrogenase [Pseudomonadota bacterium]
MDVPQRSPRTAPPGIRREALRIAGERVATDAALEVRYPYTGEVIGTVPRATPQDVRRAFAAARSYRCRLTRFERAEILRRAAALIAARRDELARLITLESGLCLKDSVYETERAEDVLEFTAQQALVDDGQTFSCDLTARGRSRKVHTLREPLAGVISAITPFNHPLNQVVHKVAPAVATGNRIVVKPTEKAPLTALAFADILYEAGLPGPMLSVVTGDPAEIGEAMVADPDAELVAFTGGVEVGKAIAGRIGYKRLVLELGGNDPLIVLEDADLERAADLAAWGSYRNSGQRCTAVKRVLVHESIAEPFTELLAQRTRLWRCGDPLDPRTDVGTLIDEDAARRVEARVGDAVRRGARLLAGGERRGASYPPTVLDRVTPDMALVQEETFGPVSPVIAFRDLDEAIAIANGTRYGLSAAVCTDRADTITRLVQELEVGSVNVWEVPAYRLELAPFGGIKDSGLGVKEGIVETMRNYTHVKTWSQPW